MKQNPACGFMQSLMWAEFKKSVGWETHHIGVFENDRLIGGASIMKFHFSPTSNFLYIPQGPVISYEDPARAEDIFHGLMSEVDKVVDLKGKTLTTRPSRGEAKQIMRPGGATTHLRMDPRLLVRPDYFLHLQKSPFNMEPKHTRMVDLRFSPEEILQNMKPKGRYNVKIAQKHEVKVVPDHSDSAIGVFYKLYSQTVTRQEFDGKSEAYFRKLIPALVAHGMGELYVAHKDGEALAAAFVIFYGTRATYFFGASSNRHRTVMAPYLLHFEIMKAAQKHGCHWYDLWGVAPKEDDASHDWHGITQFKNKFGGERFHFIGAYDFIYNQQKYAEFLHESGEVPEAKLPR